MLYAAFTLLFLILWALFAAVLPRILRGLHALANRGAGMSMRYGVVQRVVHHASRFRDYLPVALIVIAGALLAMWAGDSFLDLAEMVHTKSPGLQQIDDPAKPGVTALNSTSGSFSNRAITDANGNLLLVNPAPGSYGNLGLSWIEGPADFKLDMNLIKRVRLAESKELQIQVNAINVLNHVTFVAWNTIVNSAQFGLPTRANAMRTLQPSLRVRF